MRELPPHLGGQTAGNVDLGVVRAIARDFRISSLVDIGCGDGLAAQFYAEELGLEVSGIDGDWQRLPQDPRFTLHDFTKGTVAIAADLAYSVEFLEHLAEEFLPNAMVAFAACRFAVVTAAPPGRPGHHHVNCRDQEYWRGAFAEHGFALDDDYSLKLREVSTMRLASGPKKGMRVRHFKRSGMFFRKVR